MYLILTIVTVIGLAGGTILHLLTIDRPAHLMWAAAIVAVLLPLAWSVLVTMREGRIGVDMIALCAMVASLVLSQYLAGAVIALMMSGGNALEEYAQRRASRSLRSLVDRMPRFARVRRSGGIEDVAVGDIRVDDIVVIRAGEVLPIDGMVLSERCVLDESTVTGESMPVERARGELAPSGCVNAGSAFEVQTIRDASQSTYASIVKLVQEAIAHEAPMVRMVDRYSTWFLAFTAVLSIAAWAASGDAVRLLAVLVVATPCPLILAPPVALVSGTARAARHGIVMRGGGAVEQLGRVGSMIIDKTGTITMGRPEVESVHLTGTVSEADVLAAAGSIEQISMHSIAQAIAARAAQDAPLAVPDAVHEEIGRGISGRVDGHEVFAGLSGYLRDNGIMHSPAEVRQDGAASVHVAMDGKHVGVISLIDRPRIDALTLVERLHQCGVRDVIMATGDREDVAQRIAAAVGIKSVVAHCTPQDKLDVIARERAANPRHLVAMVGDGVNDAPALAAADVGIAIGGVGSSAAVEAADVVIVRDEIGLVADAVEIGRRSVGIARQSIIAGMSMSIIAMGVATAGYLPPVWGALLQEVIDFAVVVNALRALR